MEHSPNHSRSAFKTLALAADVQLNPEVRLVATESVGASWVKSRIASAFDCRILSVHPERVAL